MAAITLVTGNPHKLRELQSMAPPSLEFTTQKLDLIEPQYMDLREIVTYKVKHAFAQVGEPVIVEDVSAGLDSLNGLPGPFIKFFEERLGRGAMYTLSNVPDDLITILCMCAYFDGKSLLYGEGELHGTIVAPRGTNGFGFDCCVVPDGHDKTIAEMAPEKKNRISHRGMAFRNLLSQLS